VLSVFSVVHFSSPKDPARLQVELLLEKPISCLDDSPERKEPEPMSRPIRVTIWNEHRHERNPSHKASQVYPEGMHAPIAQYLGAQPGIGDVRVATLDEPEHGLTEAVLSQTDVLTWWGHGAHAEVQDEVVTRVHRRVLEGMGLIVLHSGHFSKIFQKLMGTTCNPGSFNCRGNEISLLQTGGEDRLEGKHGGCVPDVDQRGRGSHRLSEATGNTASPGGDPRVGRGCHSLWLQELRRHGRVGAALR
jgi:hypothetical protein